MKVLVLGGTGAMGVHLVRYLADAGHDVHVTSRFRNGRKGSINFIQGNAHDLSFLNHILSEHWDGIVDFMVYSTEQFKARNEQLLKSTSHYLYLSSSRVYANSDVPLTENSPRLLDSCNDQSYLAADEYALTKARQEDILFNSPYKNWTIIRPYITYDTERLQLGVLEKEDWLYRAVHGRSVVLAKEILTAQTTMTSGRDVAKAMAALLGNVSAQGEAFHITTDENISWQQVANIYKGALQAQEIELNIVEQNTADFLAWRTGKYQVIYDRLYNRVFDNSKIKQFINTSEFTSPEIGLKECLNEFLSSKPYRFKMPNWQEEALKDRITKQNTALKEIAGNKQKIKYILFKTLPTVGRLLTK